jgi:hypothetical protein
MAIDKHSANGRAIGASVASAASPLNTMLIVGWGCG